jgi:hypothetical protein
LESSAQFRSCFAREGYRCQSLDPACSTGQKGDHAANHARGLAGAGRSFHQKGLAQLSFDDLSVRLVGGLT